MNLKHAPRISSKYLPVKICKGSTFKIILEIAF